MVKSHMDTSEFDKMFKEICGRKIPQVLAVEGVGKAAMQCLNDCTMIVPSVPLDEGTLRGSGSVFVNNTIIGTSHHASGKGTPTRDHNEPLNPTEITGVIGFNTVYAARVHEVPMNFKEPGSGNKYLESKLTQLHSQYMAIIAMVIKNGGNA